MPVDAVRGEYEETVILDFQMNSLTTVEPIAHGTWRIVTRSEDDLFSGEVTLEVKAPALDIRQARLEVRRDELGLTPDLSQASERLIGVRVGPGMTRIVRGILGGSEGSQRMADIVLEAMEMLINAITVPELRKAAEMGGVALRADSDGPKVFLNNVVISDDMIIRMSANPRLKDSCAVFRDLPE
jgi:hypothetical protein